MNLDPTTSIAIMQASQGQAMNMVAKTKESANVKTDDVDIKKLEGVAKDFEAMFVSEMMKPMFEGIKPDSNFGGGKGEEIFQGMMLQEYGKMMAETGQIGIADAVKQELINMQAEANNGGRSNIE